MNSFEHPLFFSLFFSFSHEFVLVRFVRYLSEERLRFHLINSSFLNMSELLFFLRLGETLSQIAKKKTHKDSPTNIPTTLFKKSRKICQKKKKKKRKAREKNKVQDYIFCRLPPDVPSPTFSLHSSFFVPSTNPFFVAVCIRFL